MKLRTLPPAVVLALACILPLAVSAQGPSPITITDCSVRQYIPTAAQPYWGPFWYGYGPYPPYVNSSPYTDGVHISYVNNGSQVATRVAFVVDYRGDIEHIIDAGKFSPGVTIDHTFGQLSGLAWLGPRPNFCRAVAVRFADGTAWHGPHPQLR